MTDMLTDSLMDEEVDSIEGSEKDDTPEIQVIENDEIARIPRDLSLRMHSAGNLNISSDTDATSAYLMRLNYIEPLPAEEQQKLAERYVNDDDMEAGKLLILTNLRLVVKLAREYSRRWSNLLDLIQEGNVGLAEALKRYDPYRGVKFTSYAQYWIRAMILNYLMNHVHPVKIGSSRAGRKLFYNLKKARRDLIKQGHPKPTPALIAEYLDVDEKEVIRVAAQLDAPPVRLDAEAPGYDATTIGERMEAEGPNPEEQATDNDLSQRLKTAMINFGEQIDTDRKRAIWYERMISEDPKTLVTLGEEWDVSKERIRQVEVQIREEFKQYLFATLGQGVEIEFLESIS
ncbi:MAG: RNA polymerase sigma factor RpoD/SigA [Bradymonadaceae bacterium]